MTNPLYDNIDSNDIESRKEHSRLYQPNFTRSRHAYRGPRESEKINLEIQQLAYDLAKILATLDRNDVVYKDFMAMLETGIDQESDDFEWADFTESVDHYHYINVGDLEDTIGYVDFESIYDTACHVNRSFLRYSFIIKSITQYAEG